MPANKPFWEEDEETLVMDEEDIDAGSTSPAKIIVYNDDHKIGRASCRERV